MPRHLKRGMDASAIKAADAKVRETVEGILAQVEERKDAAIRDLSKQFDNWAPKDFRLSPAEIEHAIAQVPKRDLDDIKFAQAQVRNFAQKQKDTMRDLEVETLPGVILGHRHIPVNAIGCYVPGGRYPMVASAHMSIVTAKVAGVKRIIACAPPFRGAPHPAIVAAMHFGGADEIYVLGGVQAVAMMALGTGSVEAVDMIVGPGNAYVAAAKREVFGRVGIDSIAGPSEILVVADGANDPAWIAADLLSQAEHDASSQSVLITDDGPFADSVAAEVERQLAVLPRRDIAGRAWQDHGAIIVVGRLEDAAALVDAIAPEHLEIATADPPAFFARVKHAGAVFLGRHTPEAIGDYIAGPNHVLPTSRNARFSSGLSVLDFLKRTSVASCDAEALSRLGPAALALAQAEGLAAHGRSIAIRLNRK